MPAATARLVNAVRAGGGRVVAVGTTVTRALESAVDRAGRLVARSRLDRADRDSRRAAARGHRPGHRMARPAGLAPAARRGGRRAEH